VACHGFGGKGGYPNPGAVGGAIPALNKAYEGFTKAELAAKIRAGVPEPQKADPNGPAPMVRMPSWGGYLTPAEIDAVAEFVLSLRPGEAAPSDW
jgi:mono/diheme cytochrome c family protein